MSSDDEIEVFDSEKSAMSEFIKHDAATANSDPNQVTKAIVIGKYCFLR